MSADRRTSAAGIACMFLMAGPNAAIADALADPWAPTFDLALQASAVASTLFEMPCPLTSAKEQPSCATQWGIVTGLGGTDQLAGWSLVPGPGLPVPGAQLTFSGAPSFLPTGGVRPREGALLFNSDTLVRAQGTGTASDPVTFEDVVLSASAPTDGGPDVLANIGTFGIFDVAYSDALDLYALGLTGMVTFWEETGPGGATLQGLCRVGADGGVPFLETFFSDAGDLAAARHGAWTVVMSLPDRAALGPATGEIQLCASVEVSDIHYFPPLALSPAATYLAVMDEEYVSGATGVPPDIDEYVLGIYDAEWLVTAPNQGGPFQSASSVTSAGLVANFFGHETAITQVDFAPDESAVLSVTEDGALRLWSLPDGAPIGTYPTIEGLPVDAAVFDRGSNCVLVARQGGGTRLLNPSTGDVVQPFPDPSVRFVRAPGHHLVTYSPGAAPIRAYAPTSPVCGVGG